MILSVCALAGYLHVDHVLLERLLLLHMNGLLKYIP
jgi:hypothetical protein